MKVIKRNGSEVEFDISKIHNAIQKANESMENPPLTDDQINDVSEYVEYK